ncbi:phosphohistidine phosphatase, SixA [Pyrolobus fumarii 1A]|uniref:Phosphohistidine phosphatase, SixA n=1 Tax=Pyrolobus fumarii (strain DSM 11204 / 1A) TaxID=694429 RepID=G0EE26_PYRF1|nr:histidine phosphatase family protein [Pyrolobus fumarii]AEM37942.1 phosphohistidine phosphatase, SixA [Pyrolobus fumarii 1A]
MANDMLIILFRHGRAVSKEEAGSDEERWLTKRGRCEVEAVARLLPVKPPTVYTSPLRRARETAEVIAAVHGSSVRLHPGLAPGADLGALKSVEELRDGVVFVGHNPDLEEMIEALTGGRVRLAAGTAAGIEVDENLAEGRLVFLIPPSVATRVHPCEEA